MSALRTALMLVLAGGSANALAERITCESHNENAEACGTVQPGSSVRIVRQLSNSPCVKGRSWDSGDDSIWVSHGCRAVFDVTPPADSAAYNDAGGDTRYDEEETDRSDYARRDSDDDDEADAGNNERRDDGRDEESRPQGRHYARAQERREQARQSCAYQAASDRSFGPEEVHSNDTRWIGEGRLSLRLDTPDGPMTCVIDRDGNAIVSDER